MFDELGVANGRGVNGAKLTKKCWTRVLLKRGSCIM